MFISGHWWFHLQSILPQTFTVDSLAHKRCEALPVLTAIAPTIKSLAATR